MKLATHCLCYTEKKIASKLVLRKSSTRQKNRGWQSVMLLDKLIQNIGIKNLDQLKTAIMGQDNWRQCEMLQMETQPKLTCILLENVIAISRGKKSTR